MAAPINAYRSQSIWTRNKDNTADVETLTAILQTDKATMLSRFALDELFNVRLTDGTDGVVGICKINSDNYLRHADNRIGNLRTNVGGFDAVLYNDAGLATKPLANLTAVKSWAANRLKVEGTFKSSFYDISTGGGFQMLVGGTWSNCYYTLNLPAKDTSVNVSDWIGIGLVKGMAISLRAYMTNSEGTFYSTPIAGTLTDAVFQYLSDYNQFAADATNTTQKVVYFRESDFNNLSTLTTQPAITGIYMYKDELLSQVADVGYYQNVYINTPEANQHRVLHVNNKGEIDSYVLVQNPAQAKDIRFDLRVDSVTGRISVDATVLSGVKGYAITFSGKIQALSAPNGEPVLISGNANFTGTIPANSGSVSVLTSVIDVRTDPYAFPPAGSYKPQITIINPSNLTYDVFEIIPIQQA